MKKHQSRLNETFQRVGLWGRAKSRLTSTIAMASIAGVATITAALLGASPANAWGPNRTTFTMASPATYVTFNSITDDPSWTDERVFTVIKDITASGEENDGTAAAGVKNAFTETAKFVDGHTYMVKMFVHNNASSNLNLIATNTRVMAYAPTSSGTSAMIQGMIAADNCGANTSGATGSSCVFWDEAYITTDDDSTNFSVAYVKDSARYYNNSKNFETEGFTLDNAIVTTDGAKLGYDEMNGNVQGCFEYSGYATFLITANADTSSSSFSLKKRVRKEGETEWHTSLSNVSAGETLEYAIGYDNTGETTQSEVLLLDSLAKSVSVSTSGTSTTISANEGVTGLTYVSGSGTLINANHESGAIIDNDDWTTNGLNIGSYEAGTNAYVTYKATVPAEEDLLCGENTFDNVVFGYTKEAGTKMASTQITVTRNCSNVCEYNSSLSADDPSCVAPSSVQKCQYNQNLTADDPNCVAPGVPSAGSGIKTAILSCTLFIACAIVLSRMILKKKSSSKLGR